MGTFPNALAIADCTPFHCSETAQPFHTCSICQRSLFVGPLKYVVEKAYRRRPELDAEELVFELAVCLDCHDELASTFSEESRARIDWFFTERVNTEERTDALLQQSNLTLPESIGRCMVHNTPKADLSEYQIMAYCNGQHLYPAAAAMLGGPALDELVEELSAHTLDELRRFRDTHFDVPPELKELLSDRWAFV